MVTALKASGVRRVYGIPGDTVNGFMDALRRDGEITWEHVRHEEAAGFAAAAEAAVTGQLAVCAGSCGPGNLHLINGLFDANRSRVPVLAIATQIPREEIGGNYFQETHPQELFRECSVYRELVSTPEQLPWVLEIAMRAALERGGVAVVVVPGEIFFADAPAGADRPPVWPTSSVIRPADTALAATTEALNAATRVTILAGAGCAGAHQQLIDLAAALQAPVVHAFRGKEFVEYDNPYDVGMTGLIGFSSGYRAMEHCDALVMLGTDSALGFVELEMKAAGIVTYGTDLDNPDFAGIAKSAGLFGATVAKADELEDTLRAAFGHDGPALVNVRTARQELALPPKLTFGQIKGFTLYATRTILSGGGEELVELTKTNLRELAAE